MFSVSQAALRLGVCIRTLHRWDKAGKLHCFRTIGGHRRIPLSEINRLLGIIHRDLIETPSKKRCAIYARVSSHRQKNDGDLDRQLKTLTKVCRERFKSSPIVFTDVGSGLIAGTCPPTSGDRSSKMSGTEDRLLVTSTEGYGQ